MCSLFPSLEGIVCLFVFSVHIAVSGFGLMEKAVDHCNIFVDELDCKPVLVFHCKHVEEKERVREREKEREKDKERDKNRKRDRDRKGKKDKGRKRNKE